MLKKIALLGLTVALGAALSVPVFAANAIQGSVGNITVADAAALGSTAGDPRNPACRVYSISGADAGINANTPTCLGIRCARNYNAANSAYFCNTENTAGYNLDSDAQTFYEITDGEVNPGACNHAAFYSAQGQVASSAGNPLGDFRTSGCPGATPTNCFEKSDTESRPAPLLNVNSGYQTAHTLGSIGGLSPVPTIRVANPGGCPAGQVKLTWDDPETYAGAMKNGVASPVLGIKIYSHAGPCSACPGGTGGWTAVAGGSQALGTGAAGICVVVSGDTWYAATVRFRGPTTNPTEIESGMNSGVGFVGANSQCVGNPATASRITNLAARYAGRGAVNVTWSTGTEGGIQAFYVARGSSPSGPFTRVSQAVTPQGDGHNYAVNTKVHAALGRVQYYAIEIVNANGTIEHSGPAAVNLPAAKKQFGQ